MIEERQEPILVILDDDPTGTQTVYDLHVLTCWDLKTLQEEFERDTCGFYILTNSRSMPKDKAYKLIYELTKNLEIVSRKTKKSYNLITRGDSTLRGHFPTELQAISQATNKVYDGWIIMPCFMEGKRITLHGVHYILEGNDYIPVAETPFAKDKAFGFKSSHLAEWVEEKTKGQIKKYEVMTIDIDMIRSGNMESLYNKFMELEKGKICIVDGETEDDIEKVVTALIQAEQNGKKFLYRTAASFVKKRLFLETRPLLETRQLSVKGKKGGLCIIGSYVPKTTSQLEYLLKHTNIQPIEIEVMKLLNASHFEEEIEIKAQMAKKYLEQAQDVVIYTSRELISGEDAVKSLEIGNCISKGLVSLAQKLYLSARYIIAKGGITSSDIVTRGLGIKRALVKGQILPGIPVWQIEKEMQSITYIVFPGNVGNEEALAKVVKKLGE